MNPVGFLRRAGGRVLDLAGRIGRGLRRLFRGAVGVLSAVLAFVLVGAAVAVGAAATLAFAGVLAVVAALVWLAHLLPPAAPGHDPSPETITV
ncbi:MAG: hypothetical protein ABEI39_03720 [Halobacteriales archaeon]